MNYETELTVYFTDDEMHQLKDIADAQGISIQSLIERMVRREIGGVKIDREE